MSDQKLTGDFPTDSTLPLCPKCGVDHRTYIRARDQVWFICHEHKLRWRADYWCAGWSDKPERGPLPLDWSDDQIWQHREMMLRDYAGVEGVAPGSIAVETAADREARLRKGLKICSDTQRHINEWNRRKAASEVPR